MPRLRKNRSLLRGGSTLLGVYNVWGLQSLTAQYAFQLTIVAFQRFWTIKIKKYLTSQKKIEKVVFFIKRMQKVGQKCSGHRFGIWNRTYLLLRNDIEDPYSCLVV